jgi:cell division protein FtsN
VLLALVALVARAEESPYALGLAAYDRGDYAAAIEAWRPLAREGDARAQFGLGLIFRLDRPDGPADDEEALHWLRRAALQGVPAAQNNLAILYAEGRGIPAKPELAVYHWREAADAGHGPAMINLASALLRGFGAPSDPAEAAHWYRAAAAQDRPDAQRALAALYREGRGVPQDEVEARRLEEAAAAAERIHSAVSVAPEAEPLGAPAAPEPQAVEPPPAPGDATPPAVAAPVALAPGLYVQLASLPSADDAAATAGRLERSHADVLAGLRPTVQQADLGTRGIWYRVLVGPFESADRAHWLCDALRSQPKPADCLVVPR